jgi:hypothetical protein
MKVQIFAVSETAVIDQSSNRVSLFNLFENSNAVSFPIIIQSMTIVASIVKEDEDGDDGLNLSVRISIDEESIFEFPAEVAFLGQKLARSITHLQGMVITKPGLMRFELMQQGNALANWDVRIVPTGPEVTVQPTAGAEVGLPQPNADGPIGAP